MARQLTILDTGAGSNFVRTDTLAKGGENLLEPGEMPTIADANGRPLRTCGTVSLVVRLPTREMKCKFIVCERLAAPVILGGEFNDKFVEAIYPRRKMAELDDGTKIPILRKPTTRRADAPPLPSEQEYDNDPGRVSPKLKVSRSVIIQPGMQVWVHVTSGRTDPSALEPNPQRYAKHRVSLQNRVSNITALREFKVLVANSATAPKHLSKIQVLGYVTPHPRAMIRTAMPLDAFLAADVAGGTEPQSEKGDRSSLAPSKEDPQDIDAVSLQHLPSHVRTRVRDMLTPYSRMWSGDLGEVRATRHRIELNPGSKPFRCQPYRAGPRSRQAEQDAVDGMISSGVISRSQSEWASPVVLIPKPDGSLRFCVDYRRLNAMTVRDTYPIPRMDECLDSLGEANVFTTLDCNSGYWQIPVAEEDRPKTTFTCHAGTYQFNRMPFGLMNAPATFERMLDILLSGYRWKSCLIVCISGSLNFPIQSPCKPMHRIGGVIIRFAWGFA